jgi:hypothetical protein
MRPGRTPTRDHLGGRKFQTARIDFSRFFISMFHSIDALYEYRRGRPPDRGHLCDAPGSAASQYGKTVANTD